MTEAKRYSLTCLECGLIFESEEDLKKGDDILCPDCMAFEMPMLECGRCGMLFESDQDFPSGLIRCGGCDERGELDFLDDIDDDGEQFIESGVFDDEIEIRDATYDIIDRGY